MMRAGETYFPWQRRDASLKPRREKRGPGPPKSDLRRTTAMLDIGVKNPKLNHEAHEVSPDI